MLDLALQRRGAPPGRPHAGERGALKPGYWADLLLFDPARVDRGPRERVFDLPGGHPRLTTAALGVEDVRVNGVRLEKEARPGCLLRDFSA